MKIKTRTDFPIEPDEVDLIIHEGWLDRWRIGPGRLVYKNENISHWKPHGGSGNHRLDRARFLNCDLSNSKLAGWHFTRATIRGCSLEEAILAYSSFDDATIEGCSFDRAGAYHVDLTRAKVHATTFEAADLRWTIWDSADVRNVSFRGAEMPARLKGARFVDCAFRDADLRYDPGKGGARFERCDFRGAKMEEHQHRESVFIDCTFGGEGYR